MAGEGQVGREGREGRQGEGGQEKKGKGKAENLAPTVISKSRRLCLQSLTLDVSRQLKAVD